ncbi:ATP-binding protein [Cohnella sp. AR92]|uniref:ATP-binding protein n=1 Tax=Cohnella sp. AR92 TaxID=648716 RepID=UPI000F8CE19D|nr:ATP-binding protein [Cohnella sp. AR92]RUS44626.1 response regulator [Cohnella sp. AR92]
MHRLYRRFQRSMLWRVSGLQLSFFVLLLIGVAAMNADEHRAMSSFQHRADELSGKERMLTEITRHMNVIFYNSREFVERQGPDSGAYNRIMSEQAQLEASIEQYRKLELSQEEQKWLGSLDAFFESFFDRQLPEARKQAEKDGSNPRLLEGQLNELSNEVLVNAYQVMESNQSALAEAQQKLDRRLSGQTARFVLYGLAVLPLALFLYYRMVRDLSFPIRRLSLTAKNFASGRLEQPRDTGRIDEIGELARSLHSMMNQIQSKEEELLAQNEELLAQQDELQMQQEELTGAIVKMEANERFLQRRNGLVQALANTLDRQELLDSIIYNLVMLTESDKGMAILLDGSRDHASFGLSEEGISQLIRSWDEGIFARVLSSRRPYTIKRPANESEKGYVTEEIPASDMYVPVLGSDGVPVAVIGLTSVGRRFTSEDEEEMVSFALQVSLSLEKLRMYETAEHQRILTQDMLDTIQEGIQLLNAQGTTIQVNRTWREMMGLPAAGEIAAGREECRALLSSLVDEPEPLLAFLSSIADGREDVGAEIVYKMRQPQPRIIRMYYEPMMRSKERKGYLLVHQDITKEYEADQLKSEFVSTVSHELRTPLASVLGFAELLLYKKLAPERQTKYISTIHQEATRLTALINDFLDLQRMESGRMTYELRELELGSLVKETMELHAMQSDGHRFLFEDASEAAVVLADKDKIEQVLLNVIGNAVKYSPGGGDIKVSCLLQGNQLRVAIEDQGLGIPEESLPKLFEKFYRVDNGDRRAIGGTGLGLSIVKEIMTMHEGEVEVASAYGQGTTVTLAFPLAKACATDDRGPKKAWERGEEQMQILLVEDDASLSELLAEELRENGYSVISCDSGEGALAWISEHRPDAVVLDLLLSKGMSGLEFLERMKADERFADTPVLVSSAFEEKERALELGARGYLVKPYQPSMLSESLRRLLAEAGN